MNKKPRTRTITFQPTPENREMIDLLKASSKSQSAIINKALALHFNESVAAVREQIERAEAELAAELEKRGKGNRK